MNRTCREVWQSEQPPAAAMVVEGNSGDGIDGARHGLSVQPPAAAPAVTWSGHRLGCPVSSGAPAGRCTCGVTSRRAEPDAVARALAEAGAAAGLSFAALREANVRRCERDFKRAVAESTTAFALGLGEEVGEVLGAVRTLAGISRGKTATAEDVANELSDVVTYADLLAASLGIDLGAAVARKFNAVSKRVGSSEALAGERK